MTLDAPNHPSDQIDATLRRLGSVVPAPGLEDRVLLRLASEDRARSARFFSFPQLAVGVMATMVGGAVIVAGSISHSRHMLPVAPGIHLPMSAQPGVGAASAAHVATRPVTAMPDGRPRSVRKAVNGRAVIAPDAKKHNGLAVPKAPLRPE